MLGFNFDPFPLLLVAQKPSKSIRHKKLHENEHQNVKIGPFEWILGDLKVQIKNRVNLRNQHAKILTLTSNFSTFLHS